MSILRAALSDDLVLMYLGFASRSDMQELEESLAKLKQERAGVKAKLDQLLGQSAGEKSPGPAAQGSGERVRTLAMERQIATTRSELSKIEHHIEARTRALPLYKACFKTDGLIEKLRSQRNHPVHTLLRRLYYEKSS